MNIRKINDLTGKMKLYGRTYLDEESDTLYFNWTCSGMEFQFRGTYLAACFHVLPGVQTKQVPGETPGSVKTEETSDWPWLAVFVDGSAIPYRKLPLDREEVTVTIFHSEVEETHSIRFVKLTECFRAAVGVSSFIAEGDFLRWTEKECKRIEFIGDSITCGFGNETNDGNRDFYAAEENGWMTHGAITARNMGMDVSFVCVSGISVGKINDLPASYVMNDLYPYTDRLLEDKLAAKRGQRKESYKLWSFAEHVSDIIVLNLGTNDATQIEFSADISEAEGTFRKNYYEFIKMIREYNGKHPQIICALGSIDYYLYDTIRRVVEQYKQENDDSRISCFKYTKMLMKGADVGASFHPSVHRHEIMARELTAFIRNLAL